MLIYDAALKTPYRILGINLPKDSLLHLSNLGLAAGETIEVVTKTKNSAIIIVKGSRLAFDASILDKIDLAPAEEDQEKIPLSELPVGRSAIVTDIFSANETKRRLMDMGITKRTRVLLRKVASASVFPVYFLMIILLLTPASVHSSCYAVTIPTDCNSTFDSTSL